MRICSFFVSGCFCCRVRMKFIKKIWEDLV